MQIQDIELIFYILSLVFLSNIKILLHVTCSVKNHIKYYIFNNLQMLSMETFILATPLFLSRVVVSLLMKETLIKKLL